MKKVNCRFPTLLFLLGMIFTGCSDSINTMLEEYNDNFEKKVSWYSEPQPGDPDFNERNMLFDEYGVTSEDTLNLSAPGNCNEYTWTMEDPDEDYAVVTVNHYGVSNNKSKDYAVYIPTSGLKCGKTYRLHLWVRGKTDNKEYNDWAAIIIYKHYDFSKVTVNSK